MALMAGQRMLSFIQAAARSYDDADVHMELAEFLTEEMSDYKELKDGKYVSASSLAEEQMVLAVEANPKDPAYLVALANHLSDSRRRRSDANVLYQQVLLVLLAPPSAPSLRTQAMMCERRRRWQ